MKFKEYVEIKNDEEAKKDIAKTLSKIPTKHSKLVKDYEVVFEPTNCLKNDTKHIGLIDEKNKKIIVAAPWNYSREFTLLHEVAHAVWKYLVSEKQKENWNNILKKVKTKNKKDLNQNSEEIFCMSYAQYYAKNKLEKYDHKELVDFISKI